MLITLKCLTTSCVQLVDSQVYTLFYAGHIYAVVALRNNEWDTNYWMARCLDGKHTLIASLSDSEGNDFPIGSMVIKGEYLTHVSHTREKKGYVFDIIDQVKLYTIIQTQLLAQTSSCKQCQTRTHQSHDTFCLTPSTRG